MPSFPPRTGFLIVILASLLLVGWILSVLLTRLSISLARRWDAVARPNDRTSHEGAIPRIGGVGIALPVLALLGIIALVEGLWGTSANGGGEATTRIPILEFPFAFSLFLGGAAAFLIGLWDDVRTLRAVPKLILQIVIALIPPVLGIRLTQLGFPGTQPWELSGWIGGGFAFLWILFWMNAYNFMDGINGMAGRFGEFLSLSLLVITVSVRWQQALPLAFLAGSCFGFLFWNLPQARTFMGDCGSQFLGFLFAVWTLHLPILIPQGTVFPAMILLTLPFSWDVVYTLIRRAFRGENLLVAHRSHLYQRLNATGLTHRQTLSVCEKTFAICSLSAIFLVLLGQQGKLIVQWGSLMASFLAMILYTLYVLGREKGVGETPTPSPDS